jgi:hypothetical protein
METKRNIGDTVFIVHANTIVKTVIQEIRITKQGTLYYVPTTCEGGIYICEKKVFSSIEQTLKSIDVIHYQEMPL